MNRLKQAIAFLLTFLYFSLSPTQLKADILGGDVAVLTAILTNALQQLAQLKQILSSGQDTLNMMEEINKGINDSLNQIKTIYPNADPGIYRDWTKTQDAIKELEKIYGIIVPSRESKIQQDADQSVAEAVTLNNSLYEYTKEIDKVGEDIENYSHDVSPGGAQKLSAQALGVVVHVLNALVRAQSTSLKLQAQNLAIQNRKDKEFTSHILHMSGDLSSAMKNQDTSFTMPRF